jgi:hypothetical protein
MEAQFVKKSEVTTVKPLKKQDSNLKRKLSHHLRRCAIKSTVLFAVIMMLYIGVFRCFMRSLHNLTQLKQVESSTENMNDEERNTTQNRAANVNHKKCKRAMKKQVQN